MLYKTLYFNYSLTKSTRTIEGRIQRTGAYCLVVWQELSEEKSGLSFREGYVCEANKGVVVDRSVCDGSHEVYCWNSRHCLLTVKHPRIEICGIANSEQQFTDTGSIQKCLQSFKNKYTCQWIIWMQQDLGNSSWLTAKCSPHRCTMLIVNITD